MRFLTFAFCLLPFAFCLRPASAQPSPRQEELRKKVGLMQNLKAQVPLDIAFRDESGKHVQLHEYFGRRPVMINLIQYRCHQLCSLEMKMLAQSLEELKFNIGDQFNVVTVSIDHREGPDLAADYKKGYLKEYGRPGAAAGWHFLTGDETAIQRLAAAIGYRFVYDSQSDQYMHPAAVIILTPEGKVARYFSGVVYRPQDLRFALVEAAQNRIGSPLDLILLVCFHYNPVTGKYSLAIMGVLRLAAIATVLLLGMAITAMSLRERQARRRAHRNAECGVGSAE